MRRVTRDISACRSIGSPASTAGRQRPASVSASAPMPSAYVSIRLRVNSGWMKRRWRFHRSSWLLSRPSPSDQRISL